jgi:HPt (histidine-containing phosphotransfer) domain-containing protein
MEQQAIEKEINDKAKEWIAEYGADFLVELIDVYLEDASNRLIQLRAALAGGDNETATREAHTLKSSSANVGAMGMSAIAKEIEAAARQGKTDKVAEKAQRMEDDFQLVKAALEAVRKSAAQSNDEL